MGNLLVEVIGSYNCVGYQGGIPDVVKQFIKDTNVEINFKAYNIFDENSYIDIPEYIQSKINVIKSGNDENVGFFLNGSWIELAYHNANDSTIARRKLEETVGINSSKRDIYQNTYQIGKIDVHNCTVDNIISTDSYVKDFSTFTNEFDKIVLFDSKIKNLDINLCFIDKFTYNGYDIIKLIEIVKKNPELFINAASNNTIQTSDKININDIKIRLLNKDELESGYHPCCVTGFKVDPQNKLYQSISDKYGGWGYVAEHLSRPCGFLGIVPKSIAIKNVMGVPCHDDGINPDDVLVIACLAGGDTYHSKYAGIGIATKLIYQVIRDAKEKGYKYIEGTQDYPGVHHIFEKIGFTKKLWSTEANESPLKHRVYYFFDLI